MNKILEQDLFMLLELDHLPQEKKNELFEKAYDTIIHRVLIKLSTQLQEEDLDQFKALLKAKDAEAIETFFAKKNIDIHQLLSSETLGYKMEMASLAEALKINDQQR